ncbi:MAG: S1 RNA-binding domain-containing protein, partial [Anaerolineales bacterium]
KGVVTKIEIFGAFVDIGTEVPGLIHISQLKRGHVNRVGDEIKEGDEVEVWIQKIDQSAKRIELTLIKPVSLQWQNLKVGTTLQGEVVRIENFGAFVDIGAERSGLVHVSEMGEEYVKDPRDLVKIGDEVNVTIVEIDRKKKQIRLSMKATFDALTEIEDEAEEEIPTAMELALRQALEGEESSSSTRKNKAPKAGSKLKRPEMEAILDRTLKTKVKMRPDE